MQELKERLQNYEKLREDNPKIRKAEFAIDMSCISVSTYLLTSLYYEHAINIPIPQPTEEAIKYIISMSGKYSNFFSPFAPGPTLPYKYPVIESREEAIKYITDVERGNREGAKILAPIEAGIMSFGIIGFINPGEKMLKYSYVVGKTLLDSGRRLRSYLKRMQELKRKQKEVNRNGR